MELPEQHAEEHAQIHAFVEALVNIHPTGDVFNPYNQACETHDTEKSMDIRICNLTYFSEGHANKGTTSLWIGESIGYNGNRRSGVYLYSEDVFDDISKRLDIPPLQNALEKSLQPAQTIKTIWEAVQALDVLPLTFNIFPFHSYQPRDEMTNRKPTKNEIETYIHLTKKLIHVFNITTVVAIGRIPEVYLTKHGIECTYVRHPSMGGKQLFLEQIKKVYEEVES